MAYKPLPEGFDFVLGWRFVISITRLGAYQLQCAGATYVSASISSIFVTKSMSLDLTTGCL